MAEFVRVDPTPVPTPAEKPVTPGKEAPKVEPVVTEKPVEATAPELTIKPVTDPTRPEWLPAKFKSPEELAKGYTELEKLVGKKAPAGDPPKEEPPKVEPTTMLTDAELSGYHGEVMRTGELSEASYKALEKRGIPKSLADMVVADQKAKSKAVVEGVINAAGGNEQYTAMSQWAAATLPEAELRTFNEAVQSGDASKMMFAVKGMRSLYESANPADITNPPARRVAGTRPNSGNVQPFRSTKEVTDAMRHPRYKTDPAYQAEVAARLDKTDLK